MLTLHELVTGTDPLLRYMGTAASTRPDGTYPIRRVERCDARGRPSADFHAADVLVVCDGAGDQLAAPHLRALVDRGVAALVLAPHQPDAPLAADIVSAAHGMGLTLLVPGPGSSGDSRALRERLLERQVRALHQAVDRRDRLVALTARLDRKGEGPRRLIQALAEECEARVVLVTEPENAEQHGGALDRVRSGQVRVESATSPDSGTGSARYTVLCAVGAAAPHQVLVASRSAPWLYPLRALVEESTTMVRRLQDPLALRATEDRLQEAVAAVRLSIFQALMTGNVISAMREAKPLKPEYLPRQFLTGDCVRMAVLEVGRDDDGKDEDRSDVALEVQAALRNRGLVLLCPAEDRNVNILVDQNPGAPELSTALAEVVLRKPGRAAGISTPRVWPETSIAYEFAFNSLASARAQETRIAVHGGENRVADWLPDEAVHWAHALLRPLEDRLPVRHRDTMTKASRTVLSSGLKSAVGVVGVDSTTIGRYLNAVMGALDLDTSSFSDRAVLHLALQIADSRSGEMPSNETAESPPSLLMLLRSDGAADEANRFLKPLGAEVIDLLVTWVLCGGSTQKTAETRGTSRKRVTQQLSEAGATLARVLSSTTAGSSGGYDVLWALAMSGALPDEAVPDPLSLVT